MARLPRAQLKSAHACHGCPRAPAPPLLPTPSERIYSNAQMNTRQIRAYCDLRADAERLLERAMQQQGLTARAHDRILKVARTIADLEGAGICRKTPRGAIQYRTLDRSYWS